MTTRRRREEDAEPRVFNFAEQLARGEAFETVLDSLFKSRFTIEGATMEEQRTGIDRWFTDTEGTRFAVEYKTDERAEETENFFVETVSVEKQGEVQSRGWAEKCQSDFLVLFLPQQGRVLVFRPEDLLSALKQWRKKYPTRTCLNEKYKSEGVVVPVIEELEPLAVEVFQIALAGVRR